MMVRRIEKLAVLPIFFKLEGRKIILAGGSDGAAWKAELLAASGAQVHIYAKTLSNTFVELITSKDTHQAYVHHQRDWGTDIFDGAALAICDAGSDAEAERFYDAARKNRVPVNVIDNPKYCEFQFGSIVNRSPVIVSISTNGAAPILGQAIRQKVETILPRSLGEWVTIGASLRAKVAEKLAVGAPRRLFWQIFTKRAFGGVPDHETKRSLSGLLERIGQQSTLDNAGKITLVETESNDVEMLTIKAMRALQSADIILHDHDVSNEILELARREARHILTSESSRRKMAALAAAGNHVVKISRSKFVVDAKGDLTYFEKSKTRVSSIF